LELALASNAPTAIKTQALGLLPADLDLPLSQMIVSPYMPVPDTNGEEWDRLESSSAFDALVELVLHGEYNGMVSANRSMDALNLRAAALRVFEVSVFLIKFYVILPDILCS
jgi:intracellular protein transport protein USO1